MVESFFKNDEDHNVTVHGDRYRAMITNLFIPELNNHDVQELWFQQDAVNWPPRSYDLTPLDYFLRGYVKSLVYADKPQTLDHLEDNIRRVIADKRPQILEKVIENWTCRLDYIRASRGSPVPEIIFKIKKEQAHHSTAQQVANQFLAASGKQISRKTVARRLRGGGLYARRPAVCVPLTRQHRTDRLQFCREHHNWTEQDWTCVLFSDESRFSLSSDCRRQLIWRESGTAYRPKIIQEKDRYPTCIIMVWAGIMINGRTCLHVVAKGTMTGQRYIDEVLLPHVRLFRGAVGDKFVFMDDNATCHRTLAVQDCLDSEGIQRLVWPARSPDLNPIENVWDALGRQVAGRNYPPTNKNTLIRALTEEWDKFSQQLLDNVVQSIVRRVECCIPLHGGHIPL
ncbi:transposable element Tcb2 transposase [Trichonephila clavipes]|nr:transposable element Tcb2 transposase [Trichonephila clavipes]